MINTKIGIVKKELDSISDAKFNETKSSAGDKFETSREMMQQEEDKLSANLKQLLLQQKELDLIKIKPENRVNIGALVSSNLGLYMIAVGLGKVNFNNKTFYVISPISPVGKLLLSKKVGDLITFNSRNIQILNIA